MATVTPTGTAMVMATVTAMATAMAMATVTAMAAGRAASPCRLAIQASSWHEQQRPTLSPHRAGRKTGRAGQDIRLHQSLRMRDRRRHQNRRLRGDSKRGADRVSRESLQPHLHLRGCDGGGRGVYRAQRDLYQRPFSARDQQ